VPASIQENAMNCKILPALTLLALLFPALLAADRPGSDVDLVFVDACTREPMSGLSVTLFGPQTAEACTGQGCRASFSGLLPGVYQVLLSQDGCQDTWTVAEVDPEAYVHITLLILMETPVDEDGMASVPRPPSRN
jgi:hypothetical protein